MKAILRPATRRTLTWVVGGTAILWLAFVAYLDWAMHQTPEVFGHVMAKMPMPAYFLFPFETIWMHARAGHLGPGDTAPDFTVKTLETRTPVQLASLWNEKPVVLIFGSYT